MKKELPAKSNFAHIASHHHLSLVLIFLISLANLFLLFTLLFDRSSLQSEVGAQTSTPIISVITPQPGTNLTGLATVNLAYPPGTGFAQVQAYVDNTLVETLKASGPFQISFQLDTAQFSNGPHTLKFKAASTQGQTSEAVVQVNFGNGQ